MTSTATADFVASYVMFPRHIQQTIADLITEGVLERFPELKVVSAEIDIGWIGTYLSRMDHAFEVHGHWSGACPQLTMPPSSYFHRQVYATFMDDPSGILARSSHRGREHHVGQRLPPPRCVLAALA